MNVITSLDQLDLTKTYCYADYLKWQFKERIELLKGHILAMSPAPSPSHQEISVNLTGNFFNFFHKQPCKVFTAPFDVRIARNSDSDKEVYTVVQPDLCIICDLDKIDNRGCVGAPDLVVEILSPGNSKKEMNAKFDLYEEAGVREYWLVQPLDEFVLIYTLQDGQFQPLNRKPIVDDMICSHIFPELQIHTDDIFPSKE